MPCKPITPAFHSGVCILIIQENRINILVIDDEESIVRLIGRMLAEDDVIRFELTAASTLARGIELAKTQAFDIVLLDLWLTDSEGLPTFLSLQEQAPALPVIVLTVESDQAMAHEIVKAGAQEYLVKGTFKRTALVRSINYSIARQRRQLEASERQHRDEKPRLIKLISEMPVAVLVIDSGRIIQFANPVAELMLNSMGDSLVGSRFNFELDLNRNVEVQIDSAAGRRIIAEKFVTQTEWDGRNALLACLRDISFRKEIEDQLKRERDMAELFLNVAGVMILGLDIEGRVTIINRKGCEICGWEREEIMGQNWLEKCLSDDLRDEIQVVFQRLLDGEVIQHYENPIITKSGAERIILWNIAHLRDEQGKVIGVVSSGDDITERRILEQQVRHAAKMEAIGRLAGGVAHDFNNLLTVITGNAELIMMELSRNDPLREDVNEILQASNRAANLTRQILTFSRTQPVESKIVDLNILIADMLKMLRRIIGEDIHLDTIFDENLWMVKVDPGQIVQIILNLTVNSRDAMPEGGNLTIETMNVVLDESYIGIHAYTTPGEYVMLAVSDTGKGMNKEVQENIFEPFFTTKAHGKGTGLGLSTVYAIVKKFLGYIWVYSVVEHGTVFKIHLPRVADVKKEDEIRPLTLPVPTYGSESILVVEDDPAVRKLTVRTLGEMGYQVSDAPDGKTALLIFQQSAEPFRLVITDAVMPDLSGMELADTLLSIRDSTKILLISGYAPNYTGGRQADESRLPYLQKPFGSKDLLQMVRKLLDE